MAIGIIGEAAVFVGGVNQAAVPCDKKEPGYFQERRVEQLLAGSGPAAQEECRGIEGPSAQLILQRPKRGQRKVRRETGKE